MYIILTAGRQKLSVGAEKEKQYGDAYTLKVFRTRQNCMQFTFSAARIPLAPSLTVVDYRILYLILILY